MPKRKIKFSIFVKLIILFLIFIVIVNLSIGFLISFSFDKNPVSLTKLNIRFETSKVNWTSDADIPTISELSKDSNFKNDESKFFIRYKGKPYFINKVEDGYVIFSPIFPRDYINFERAIIAIIIMVTILAALLYFSLRWIFGPIKKLSLAVGQISSGNFETSIDIKRNDELGNLADSINEMKENISNMIKAKESLLIDVSHELRSPLTRIKLANEFVEDEKIKSKIRDDIKEMEAMITELLETYRMESIHGKLHKENTDIVKLVKNIISETDKPVINLKSEFDKKEISLDKEKIEIAIKNLLDNAIKYSDGQVIEVNIFKNPLNKNETCISIKDKGKGINEEEKKKIFEPFYKIDKSRDKKIKGYGLGLSIVKKILDEHNSRIEVKSKINEGTEFIIFFQS